MTERAHGTRTKFVHDCCRCLPCRAANATYASRLASRHAIGGLVLVDPQPAREHLRALAIAGVGTRRVADLSGVPRSVIATILRGHRPDRPADRIRPDTAAAILAVNPDRAPGCAIDGTGTRRRLRALVAVGWPQARLAGEIGWAPGNFTRLINDDVALVSPRTAAAVRVLYDRLWDQTPDTSTPALLRGVNRARTRAARLGWVPPLAWDDDEIDDPNARAAA